MKASLLSDDDRPVLWEVHGERVLKLTEHRRSGDDISRGCNDGLCAISELEGNLRRRGRQFLNLDDGGIREAHSRATDYQLIGHVKSPLGQLVLEQPR